MEFDKKDTLAKVTAIVVEKLHVQPSKVTEASTFHDLGADSLDMVEIVMKLEEEFGMEIDDEDAEKLTSIDDVVDYIHQRRTK
jgi:acyl carrier protein